MNSRRSHAALARVVAEVRAQAPPATPGVLPSRLLGELRRAASGARPAPAPLAASLSGSGRVGGWLPRLAVAGALAVAGSLALGIWSAPATHAPARGAHPFAATPSALLDGRELAQGTLVQAGERPRRVEHPGAATWTLAPDSAARLSSLAAGAVRIELERGSLEAEVEPSPLPSSFIVQAQGTEVLVHGTRFQVALRGARTRVVVSEGEVQVRALGQASGTLLGAGMAGEFRAGVLERPPTRSPASEEPAPPASLQGEASESSEPAAARRETRSGGAALPPAPRVPSVATRQSPPPASIAPPGPPLGGPRGRVELDAVTERVESCFRRHTPRERELGIEARTRLLLWVEPSGELLRADFEPPLAPAVEACVAAELAQLRLAATPQGRRVERELRFRR